MLLEHYNTNYEPSLIRCKGSSPSQSRKKALSSG